MANITVAPTYAANFTTLSFNYFERADGWGWARPSYYQVTENGRYDTFEGSGFDISKQYLLTAGVVNKWLVDHPGFDRFWITGINVSAVDLMKTILSISKTDDRAMIAKFFASADTYIGGNLVDVVKLHGGNDVAYGYSGADKIYGGAGNDIMAGGRGADDLFGESGNDRFYYKTIAESTVATSGRDTIFDLQSGDTIHLANIDANTKLAGNQAFSFIGTAAFQGKAGQLRYEKQASDTYIYADVNGDKKADFAIHLDDAVTLSKGFFFL